MKCPTCSREIPSESDFCSGCGASLLKHSLSDDQTIDLQHLDLARGTTLARRYEVIEELGRGGMGRVYKVRDGKLHEDIALKILNPEIASDPAMIDRFRNELKLARKITHKQVCRMYDLGESDGISFITMEYVAGEDLKKVIRRAGMLPVERAIAIAKQICEGLAEAHALAILHRDLKSRNIMIDLEGNVRIMDFGIACSLRAPDETRSQEIFGTPDYMSPEQVDGEEADLRSDIYQLGIILYEMLTGHIPFEGDTPLSIIRKHKSEVPTDPSELNPQVSADLSQIVLKCMERERPRRYQDVRHVLRALEAVELDRLEALTPSGRPLFPPFMVDEHEASDIKKPPFVARESELAAIEKAFRAALTYRGEVVFIAGEAGCGKTALATAFASIAQEDQNDLIVANGNCNAQTGLGDPYLPFREVLSLLTGDIEARWRAKALTRDHALRLWNLVPLAVRSLLDHGPSLIGTLIEGPPLASRAKSFGPDRTDWISHLSGILDHQLSDRGRSSLQQSDLFEQCTRFLQALSVHKPLLLVLDDLQWADSGSIRLLFHLGRQLTGHRILIMGCFRLAEVALGREGERHPLESVINEFKRLFGSPVVELGQNEDWGFVQKLLDTEPNRLGTAFRETLFRQTRGHPLFTIELMRAMQEGKAIVRDADGFWVEGKALDWGSLPVRIDAVVGERVGRLPATLREILTWASVEGEEFTAEVVADVMNKDPLHVVQMLSSELDKRHQLVRAQGIQQTNGQRLSRYRFRHILFQKFLYGTMDEVELAHRHGKIGAALESRYGQQTNDLAVKLASHFKIGGVPDRAIKYLEMAGEQALRGYAYKEAIDFLDEARSLEQRLPTKAPLRRARWALWLGEASMGMGRLKEGRAHLMNAIELLDRPVPNTSGKMVVGILTQVAHQALHRAWPARIKTGPDLLLTSARAYSDYGEMQYYLRRKLPAIYAGLRALNLAEHTGASVELANSYANMCVVAAIIPVHRLARVYARLAREVAEIADPQSTLGYAFITEGIYRMGLGQWDAVDDCIHQALRILAKVGYWRRWEIGVSILAAASIFKGEFRQGAKHWRALFQNADRRGDRQNQILGLQGQAYVQLRLGHVRRVLQFLKAMDLKKLPDEFTIEKLWGFTILAKARLMQCEISEAEAAVAQVFPLIVQSDPRIASARAYMMATEVIMTLCEMRAASGTRQSGRLWDQAGRACQNLARYARVFPVTRPSFLLWKGVNMLLAGHAPRARSCWEKSMAAAQKLQMPYDLGLAHLELGKHGRGEERFEHLAAAEKIFSRLGAEPDLEKVRAALRQPAAPFI